jgi:hypothetical protein
MAVLTRAWRSSVCACDILVLQKGKRKAKNALCAEVHSIGGCEDHARLWHPSPGRSMPDRLPPGKAWVTPMSADRPLAWHDAFLWRFAAALTPSPLFLGKNCKIAQQKPTHHPLTLLCRPNRYQQNEKKKKRMPYMRISSLNRVVRARLLTFCSFGRISRLPFAGEPGRSTLVAFRSTFRSASKRNTLSFRPCNSFAPFSDGSLGGSFPSRGAGNGARAAHNIISCRARSGSGSSESICL